MSVDHGIADIRSAELTLDVGPIKSRSDAISHSQSGRKVLGFKHRQDIRS
jgi:hypothetical protein